MKRFARQLSELLSVPPNNILEIADRIASSAHTEALIEMAVSLVRTDNYDILDLHSEISHLRERIAMHVSHEVSAAASLALDEILGKCLRATVRVQELALESSVRGYAELDGQGRILNFNEAFARLVGVADPGGQSLVFWFGEDADDASTALESVISASEGLHRQVRTTIRCGEGVSYLPVIAEFGSIPNGDTIAAFALFYDISSIVDAERLAFESAEFGILRVSRNNIITFCNSKAASVIGRPSDELVGTTVDQIVHQKSLDVLRAEYQKRDKGLASRYSVDVVNDGTSHTVEVTALPEFDLDGRQRVSTLAFVRSIELERVRDKLRDVIGSGLNSHKLLSAASKIIGERIQHDKMVFTVYHGSGGWAWPIHIEPEPVPPWPTRWFEISHDVSRDLEKAYEEQGGLIVPNIELFVEKFGTDEPLRSDPTIPRLIEEGMRSTLTLFIKEENQFVASVTLFSETEDFFGPEDISVLRKIGVENLIRICWRHFERREANFFGKLSRQIQDLTRQVGPDLSSEQVLDIHKQVAAMITKKLSRFYRWRYVSIFQCDYMSATTRLLSAYGFHQGHRREFADYELEFKSGLIGLAMRRGETVVMDDCDNDSEEARAFVRVNEETRAALCQPIQVQGRVVWVLNIEDDRKGAFGDQDRKILSRFIEETQIALENLFVEGVLERIINESLDAILIVEHNGLILRTNNRARELLSPNGLDIRSRSFSEFIVDREDQETIRNARRLNQFRCVIQGYEGEGQHTLLTMRSLPECFGLRVIYVTDLRQLEWKHDIKVIGGAISKAAAEFGEPIATVDRVIREFAHDGPKNKEGLAKMAQDKLGHIRLTYRRIAECFPKLETEGTLEEQQLYDLNEILNGVIHELSASKPSGEWLRLSDSVARLPVWAARDHVEFVFQSALDFLRRRKADSDRVSAEVMTKDGAGVVMFACRIGNEAPNPQDSLSRADKAGRDLVSLGEIGIRRIVEAEHHGAFQRETDENGETRFIFSFPIAQGERAQLNEAPNGI